MKKIKIYKGVDTNLANKLNSIGFRFVEFNEAMKNIDLITIEKNDNILGYSILENSSDINQGFYIDLLDEIEYRCSEKEDELYLYEELKKDMSLSSTPLIYEKFDKEEIDRAKMELTRNDVSIDAQILNKKETLSLFNTALELLRNQDCYYISYMESIPTFNGNGTIMVDYIKNNYPKTILIPSGYSPEESSRVFWEKQGYKNAELLMFFI